MELRGFPERIAAFRSGDRATLTALYDTHVEAVRRLMRFGFRFTSKGRQVHFRGFDEPFRVQEAVQDGFLHAFRASARASYSPDQAYKPYMLMIIKNHLIDQFRRKQLEGRYIVSTTTLAHENESGEDAATRLDSREQASPEMEASRAQLRQSIQAFMGTLDDDDLDTIKLHMVGELTQTELAQRLGCDRNDVRKRVRTIRERLLRHLKREGHLDDSSASGSADQWLTTLLVMMT